MSLDDYVNDEYVEVTEDDLKLNEWGYKVFKKTNPGVNYWGKEREYHRYIAYHFLYKNALEWEYPLDFEEYEVHHKDKNPLNNKPKNLAILTHEEHSKLHSKDKHQNRNKSFDNKKVVTNDQNAAKYGLVASLLVLLLYLL